MIITDAKTFGEAIRKRRKELQSTQAYLPRVCGFSVSFLSNLERGKSTVQLGKTVGSS